MSIFPLFDPTRPDSYLSLDSQWWWALTQSSSSSSPIIVHRFPLSLNSHFHTNFLSWTDPYTPYHRLSIFDFYTSPLHSWPCRRSLWLSTHHIWIIPSKLWTLQRWGLVRNCPWIRCGARPRTGRHWCHLLLKRTVRLWSYHKRVNLNFELKVFNC